MNFLTTGLSFFILLLRGVRVAHLVERMALQTLEWLSIGGLWVSTPAVTLVARNRKQASSPYSLGLFGSGPKILQAHPLLLS